jgi:hypothetical protein
MADGVRVQVPDVQAWLESTKATVSTIEPALDLQIETQVLAQLEAGFDVSTWVSPGTTPEVVKSVFAMLYAATYLDRQYSEDSDTTNAYAAKLESMAQLLIAGMLDGSVVVDGYITSDIDHSGPEFFPTDASTVTQWGTPNVQYGDKIQFGDPGIGIAKFSMNMEF